MDLLDLLDFLGVAERRLRALGVLPVAILAGAGDRDGFRLCLCERAARGEETPPLAVILGIGSWTATSMLSTESVEGWSSGSSRRGPVASQ